MHAKFIKENSPLFYSMKMMDGTWHAYLEEVDTTAKEMVDKCADFKIQIKPEYASWFCLYIRAFCLLIISLYIFDFCFAVYQVWSFV